MANYLRTSGGVAKSSIAANFKWLDRLAVTCFVLFSTITVAKIAGVEELYFSSMKLHTNATIGALLVATALHFYVAKLIISALERAWRELPDDERKEYYEELVSTGGMLIRGVFSYEGALFKKGDGDVVHVVLKTRADDPPVLAQAGLAVVALLASTPFEASWLAALLLAASMSLVFFNWSIGANWAIALVDFSRPKGDDFYFSNGFGPRRVSAASGFWLSERISWKDFLIRGFLGSVLILGLIAGIFFMRHLL